MPYTMRARGTNIQEVSDLLSNGGQGFEVGQTAIPGVLKVAIPTGLYGKHCLLLQETSEGVNLRFGGVASDGTISSSRGYDLMRQVVSYVKRKPEIKIEGLWC